MKETKKSSLPRVIKTLLDIIYGFLIFVIVGLVIWMAVSPLLVNRVSSFGTASIPVRLGTGEEPRMEVTFQDKPGVRINEAFLEEAEGTLRLETDSIPLILIANGAKLIVAVGLFYIFALLRKIMKSILDGDPFAENNILLIRRLGYAVLLVGFGSTLFEGLAALEILRMLPTAVPPLQAGNTFDPRLILGAALFIFLLAQIWGYGMELERDRALTI